MKINKVANNNEIRKGDNNMIEVFKNDEFGEIRVIMVNDEPYFVGKDIVERLNYEKKYSDVIKKHCDKEDYILVNKTQPHFGDEFNYKILGQRGGYLINESGLYSLILSSKLPTAKKFKRWVTSEVLPTIRKTGGYVNNEDLFINTYFPFADDGTKAIFKSTLETVRKQNEIIASQKKTIENQNQDLMHKEDVIIGFVDEIDLAKKRQVLNRVVRYKTNNYSQRWNELYKQFEMKYHIDLKRRMETYNLSHKPKVKNKLDYIDKVLNKVSELYDIACKLYENDVKELVQEMYGLTQ